MTGTAKARFDAEDSQRLAPVPVEQRTQHFGIAHRGRTERAEQGEAGEELPQGAVLER